MKQPYLLLDCDNLLHRSFYARSYLQHNGEPSGTLFGLLTDLVQLKERFGSNKFIFCFDHGPTKRKLMYPWYKSEREARMNAPEERQRLLILKEQIRKVRDEWLPAIGFVNIFHQRGYEAEDMIAQLVAQGPMNAIIISSDADLLQLIGPRTLVFNPASRKLTDVSTFREAFKIEPLDFWKMKALTGCETDNIPGVKGVGPFYAVQFLNGTLNKSSEVFTRITEFIRCKDYNRNVELIHLPWQGVRDIKLRVQPPINPDRWDAHCEMFGYKELLGEAP
jgi:DNA polymerase-1